MTTSDDEATATPLEPAEAGPSPAGPPRFAPYRHPAAGWGAAKSVTRFLAREGAYLDGPRAVMRMNDRERRLRLPGVRLAGRHQGPSTARDGSTRSVHGYLAVPYDIPRGCAAGYMPELNVLCAIGDFSTQSDQPIMKHLKVTVTKGQSEGQSEGWGVQRCRPLRS
ncbi:hypothetical protein BG452_29380 [Streptomyces sp. CBMA123]|nr:hypothetical protein [Streptomyces sp. CBMA123]